MLRKSVLAAGVLFATLLSAYTRPIATIGFSGPITVACDSDISAFGGDLRLTLPAAPTTDGCDMVLINEDASAGKYLIGFPVDINPKLYPNQAVGFTSRAGRWVSKSKPGRYKITPANDQIFIDVNGDDTNDGFTLPLKTWAEVANVLQKDLDFNKRTPRIRPTVNQVWTDDPLTLNGSFVGGYLVQLTPNGNGKFTWQGQESCVDIGDGAWLDIRLNQTVAGGPIDQPNGSIDVKCNSSNKAMRGHFYVHNDAGFDLEGVPTFYGSGNQDNAIFFDGSTFGAASSDGFLLCGQFDTGFRMDEGGGRFTTGGSIGPAPTSVCAPPFVNQLFTILGSSQLIQSAATPGGYASLGPSIVGGKGQIVGNPGPAGYTPTQEGRVFPTKY